MNPIPRLHFAHLPTPIEELPRLSVLLGGPQILIKRDDQTGLALGGNKTRKLEFLVAEALAQGAQMLITAGAIQSNHCRQTAAAAAKFGLACMLVLTGDTPPEITGNLLLDHLFGAQPVFVADRADRDRILAETFQRAQAEGKRPYLVPYGGSSPTGALAYAFAVQEFLAQGIRADWMVFATSSGGTHAGLVLGQRVFGYDGKILGISIDEPEAALKTHVAALATAAAQKLGETQTFSAADVLATDEFCRAGYGVLTDLEREAVQLFAKSEGILLDPVYTGRAAGGLIQLIRRGYFAKNESVLFWNTGGQPALFSEKYQTHLLA
ncbi:MAG: D-cysteine desulfhydrase family protein [Anaerolineae bacterium CG_4_9_14_3_um_filter_57_17]|nr:MAG: D-cysteine desulfhydrase family protein [Anaerolineae bacterium CG_4_9_14_3_um_filter_57_17]